MKQAILALLALVLALAPGSVAQAGEGPFTPTFFQIRDGHLDDLGVVDYDRDGDLDVFTTNHLEPQSLLANDGNGVFIDTLSSLGLDQSQGFPGWGTHPQVPDNSTPGLYVYRPGGAFLIEYVSGAGPVSGSIELVTATTVVDPQAVTATTVRTASQPPRTTVSFASSDSFTVRLEPERSALPIEIAVEAPFPLDGVFVGQDRIVPSAREFTLSLRDRHGIAWADLNGDLRTDAFAVRGGLAGDISQFAGLIQDELLIREGDGFADRRAGSGIDKGACRGRIAAAVDVNRDGRLDLFSSCRSSTPKLYRANAGGGYVDESPALAAHRTNGVEYGWLDVNLDGSLELLVARKRQFSVFHRKGGGEWVERQLVRSSHLGRVRSMAVADFDRDGDPDVFAGTTDRNVVLVNERGWLKDRNPRRFGLPKRDTPAAAWTDFNNDGLVDLHVLPKGLFKQRRGAPGTFARTGLATSRRDISLGVAQWFDREGDGDRDALIAGWRREEFSVPVELLVNELEGRRWLQIELEGRPGNVEAVGARVRVRARKGGPVQTAWVGESDSSRLSQGHYRLYFGLRKLKAPIHSVVVNWPEGGRTERSGVQPDHLLRIVRQ